MITENKPIPVPFLVIILTHDTSSAPHGHLTTSIKHAVNGIPPCAHIVQELELIKSDGLPPLFEPPIGVAIYNNPIEVVTTLT